MMWYQIHKWNNPLINKMVKRQKRIDFKCMFCGRTFIAVEDWKSHCESYDCDI